VDGRRFARWLSGVAVAGLAVRLAYVVVARRHAPLWGDAYYYQHQADLLLRGHGFIVPLDYLKFHRVTTAADHPPLFTLTLAGLDLVGLRSFAAHRVAMAFIGTGTIVVVGLAGRRVGGERVGLIAAGIAAVDPSFWVNDGLVESETVVLLAAAVTVLLCYRLWSRPGRAAAAGLGVACGAAALARAEMILLVPLVAVPLAAWAAGSLRRAAELSAIVVGAAGVVIAPWVVRNLLAFEHPVYLSDGLDVTLTVANCPPTYHGDYLGYWRIECATDHPPPPGGDESVQGIWYRRLAFDYMRAHPARVPLVMAVRVGRVWGLYRPLQQARLDLIEGRELWVSDLALAWLYPVAGLSVAGALILRRRRVPVLPLAGLAVVVSVATAITYGNTRYRAAAEAGMAVLAAVAVDAAVGSWRRPEAPEPEASAPIIARAPVGVG